MAKGYNVSVVVWHMELMEYQVNSVELGILTKFSQ